jgi:hypothetical protein
MEWIWDLLRGNPWLALILLGVVGQLFTPNPKKRQQARERERERRKEKENETGEARTDPDEVAERIRELFAGKTTASETDVEDDLVLALPRPLPVRVVSEIEANHHADAGSYFDPDSIGETTYSSALTPETAAAAYGIKAMPIDINTLDLRSAVRAMMILGPPRALASYDQDPLLSLHQRGR